MRGHRRILVERQIRTLELHPLLGEPRILLAQRRHVLDRQQDDARHAERVRDEPGVEEHDLPANAREDMVDIEVVELRLERQFVAEHLAQRGDVPLAVPECEQHRTDGVGGLDPEGPIEGAVGLGDPEIGVEDEQGLPDRVEDGEQPALGGGHGGGHCARHLVRRRRGMILDHPRFHIPLQVKATLSQSGEHTQECGMTQSPIWVTDV